MGISNTDLRFHGCHACRPNSLLHVAAFVVGLSEPWTISSLDFTAGRNAYSSGTRPHFFQRIPSGAS